MRAVAIDAASRRAGVALWQDGLVLASNTHDPALAPALPTTNVGRVERAHHGERLLGLIEAAFAQAGWARTSIDLCVCGIGPGSFTGIRIGMATAKGLAWALDRPIVGIGALETMAGGLADADLPDHEGVLALLDAGRGEVFGALFGSQGELAQGPFHVPTAALYDHLGSLVPRRLLLIGEAAEGVVREPLGGAPWHAYRSMVTDLPDAAVMARVGAARVVASGPDDLDALEPLYVRPPDITLPNPR